MVRKISEVKKINEEARDAGLLAASVLPHKNFPE